MCALLSIQQHSKVQKRQYLTNPIPSVLTMATDYRQNLVWFSHTCCALRAVGESDIAPASVVSVVNNHDTLPLQLSTSAEMLIPCTAYVSLFSLSRLSHCHTLLYCSLTYVEGHEQPADRMQAL